jgi:hypothetical protein
VWPIILREVCPPSGISDCARRKTRDRGALVSRGYSREVRAERRPERLRGQVERNLWIGYAAENPASFGLSVGGSRDTAVVAVRGSKPVRGTPIAIARRPSAFRAWKRLLIMTIRDRNWRKSGAIWGAEDRRRDRRNLWRESFSFTNGTTPHRWITPQVVA